MAEKSWAGRFCEKTDRSVEGFTASIDSDKRLYPYDIEGSIAHCRTLAKADIISQKEADALIEGLGKIKQELDLEAFEFDNALEDIHMHIEARLVQCIGAVAHKLHTARSRNDQVALDLRLYLRDQVSHIVGRLRILEQVLVKTAKDNLDTIMPGYTHLQRAQPVLLSHHLMAYYEMFKRDMDRFRDGLKRINVLPLGSAALAGTTYPIDREYAARLLGFPKISSNSIDAVSDRDFIIEFLSSAGICMVHLSRLSEELVLWSSAEFNFIELPDAFATGSSIMPQKKNPDVPELVRAKTGRVFGSLLAMLTVMKSLPLSYNRDLQEDKEILFSAVDTLAACLDSTVKLLPNLKINKKAMALAASTGFLNATDMADYLVAKGISFRKAHHCVGQAVGYALKNKKELHELSLEELRSFSALIEEDIFDALSVQQMINRRSVFGGTAPENVQAAIRKAEEDIDSIK
jgi:argininosuccinate lyase